MVRADDHARRVRRLRPALSRLRQELERPAVRRDSALDPILERGLRDGRRRHQPSVHFSFNRDQRAVCGRVVDRGPGPRAGVLCRAPRGRDRDDRSLRVHQSVSLLRVLGGDARSGVSPHRRLGRSEPHLRVDQVPPLHACGQRVDARGPDRAPRGNRHTGFRDAREDEAELRSAGVALRRVHGGVRGQGADVPRAHLAAGCAHRGTHRRKRDPGWDSPEDGRLRAAADCLADPSRCGAALCQADAGALRHRDCVRRVRHAGADRREAAHRLLEHQPHGLRDARDLHVEPQRRRGRRRVGRGPRHHVHALALLPRGDGRCAAAVPGTAPRPQRARGGDAGSSGAPRARDRFLPRVGAWFPACLGGAAVDGRWIGRHGGAAVSDLVFLLPELVLAGTAVVLILIARHVSRAQAVAVSVVVAAMAAIFSGRAFTPEAPEAPAAMTAGFGGTIPADGYARFFKLLFAATLALAALLSVKHVDTERVPPAEYYALLLLASTGMMLAASAADLLILYLGLELMILCAYVLVGITVNRPIANEAAIKYFLLGSFASALLLYGIALVYGVTGATDFAAIASAVSERNLTRHPFMLAGLALMAGGLAFKIAAVPFHAWAPDVYQGASAPVAAFLAAGSKAAGLAALVRVCLAAFAPEQRIWSEMLAGLAVLSMIVGSLLAISQTNMKRLLAYSSIAHVGYALLGLVTGTPDGASAPITYAFIYSFMTLGAFGVVIALGERGEDLLAYRGLAATAPVTAALMFLFLLSLTGIPPTAGFVAKFAVILSAVRGGHVVLAVVAGLLRRGFWVFFPRGGLLWYMIGAQGG